MIRVPLKMTGKEVEKSSKEEAVRHGRKHLNEVELAVKDSAEKKEGVDGNKEVLHNLISLVLTNKTICSEAENTEQSKASQDKLKAEWAKQNTDL